jgi:hypothetical protein
LLHLNVSAPELAVASLWFRPNNIDFGDPFVLPSMSDRANLLSALIHDFRNIAVSIFLMVVLCNTESGSCSNRICIRFNKGPWKTRK